MPPLAAAVALAERMQAILDHAQAERRRTRAAFAASIRRLAALSFDSGTTAARPAAEPADPVLAAMARVLRLARADLGDERACIEALADCGFAPQEVAALLDQAIEQARIAAVAAREPAMGVTRRAAAGIVDAR